METVFICVIMIALYVKQKVTIEVTRENRIYQIIA